MNYNEVVECINQYRKAFPNDDCRILTASNSIFISSQNKTVIKSTREMTKDDFLGLVKESIENGENLFLKQWESFSVRENELI